MAKRIAAELDEIDFENYSVPAERATELRAILAKIKETSLIPDLRFLVQELGVQTQNHANKKDLFDDEKVQVFEHAPGRIELRGHDLEFHINDKRVLLVTFLPKGDEFLILGFEDTAAEQIFELGTSMKEHVTKAKKAKSDRQAAFRSKFGSA